MISSVLPIFLWNSYNMCFMVCMLMCINLDLPWLYIQVVILEKEIIIKYIVIHVLLLGFRFVYACNNYMYFTQAIMTFETMQCMPNVCISFFYLISEFASDTGIFDFVIVLFLFLEENQSSW